MAALVEGNRRLRLGHFETLGLIIGSRRAKTALIMKTLSGTFVFVALAAIGTVAVLTVRPFALATPTPTQADCPPAENAPVLIIMGKDGLQSTKSGDALKAMFDDLIKKCGDKVCNTTTSPDRPASRASAFSQLGDSRSETRTTSPPARLVNVPNDWSRLGGAFKPTRMGVFNCAGLNSSTKLSIGPARPRPHAGP